MFNIELLKDTEKVLNESILDDYAAKEKESAYSETSEEGPVYHRDRISNFNTISEQSEEQSRKNRNKNIPPQQTTTIEH